jgi:hypothetical protein
MGISFTRLEDYYVEDEEAVMQFYTADGKRTKEGATDAVVQYLSNDPNRPDAKKKAPAEDKAAKSATEDKAVKAPAEDK